MNQFSVSIDAQYVALTPDTEMINGKLCYLHKVQQTMKNHYHQMPQFVIITAPTGTGKSYAFPFPALHAKMNPKPFDENSVRGLIVLPTNALINELTQSFTQTYPQLNIKKLSSQELDATQTKGFNRWKEALHIASQSDLLITNPDILNFAMHGGYHATGNYKKQGDTEFRTFIQKFQYVIFDEYHLYDEAQIANILTMVKFYELTFAPADKALKFFFVSATPEPKLKNILEQENYPFQEIIEEITNQPHNARAIHGILETTFVHAPNVNELIQAYIPQIQEQLKNGNKTLIILDRLRDVQELAQNLTTVFPHYTIYQSTGYIDKTEDHNQKIAQAHLILATNKAEVGVNYDVTYCIMQPGRFYQNFVQRFGRVARGNKEGKIVVAITKNTDFNRLENLFQNEPTTHYYSFLEKVSKVLQPKNFYAEQVPLYWGEYLWCIVNNVRTYQEYNTFQYLNRRLTESQTLEGKVAARYILMDEINTLIRKMIQTATGKEVSRGYLLHNYEHLQKYNPRVYQWLQWWKNYLATYYKFRDGSVTVQVIDTTTGAQLDYSLDWILQHREILSRTIIQQEPYPIEQYEIGDFIDQNKDLQYTVNTIPDAGIKGNNYLSYQEKYDLPTVWSKAIERIYDKVSRGDSDSELYQLQMDLLKKLEWLKTTFSLKRLNIIEINTQNRFL
ncbi:type I-D CRISPR-associated helicase Cas3' [Sphingobacteriales bacterium UPWRP_1]|nr:type I-D CRISPR-associated helicase Cas3' [Sphingobacteriales bacterium UPWRP_1]